MSPAERTISEGQLNRALLARQLLLERVKWPIPKVLSRMGELQAQYAPSMYIGLLTRMEDFERHQRTSALESRRVVQGTLMRATIHLVSAADYWPIADDGLDRKRLESLTALSKKVGGILPDKQPVSYERLVDQSVWRDANAMVKN